MNGALDVSAPAGARRSDRPTYSSAVRQVARLGFRPDDVRDIVLTHMHFDHCGGLPDSPMPGSTCMPVNTRPSEGRCADGPTWRTSAVTSPTSLEWSSTTMSQNAGSTSGQSACRSTPRCGWCRCSGIPGVTAAAPSAPTSDGCSTSGTQPPWGGGVASGLGCQHGARTARSAPAPVQGRAPRGPGDHGPHAAGPLPGRHDARLIDAASVTPGG